MRAALVDPRGHVLLRRSAATPGHADVPAALIDLSTPSAPRATRVPHRTRSSACPVPSTMNPDACCGRPTTELSAQLDMPAHIANDADLPAVGDASFGAGAGIADVAYLTISTGIGAGVLLGGRLMRGRRSLAEVGHTVIDWVAWRDGLPSTLEELGSGSGVARLACEAGLGDVDARAVEVAAADGEPRATTIWEGAIGACAAGVANLVMSFYPSIVVIGGGLGRLAGFFDPVCALVLARPEHHPSDLTIVASALGDDAGLVGAAGWEAAAG
jgi:N-acetylmannosamine-6-phosphate 2-epimerase/N-acetylmannosamine kinase